MKPESREQPDYGNWVSRKLIAGPGLAGLIFCGLAILSLWWLIPAVVFIGAAVYFTYARFLFAERGKGLQGRIRDQVLEALEWDGDGRVLDIGGGGGALVVELARRNPQALGVGIDAWGPAWEYSLSACERNARLEGVAERVTFQKASASALPFGDESQDAVVSNLVFHEVKEVKDKRALVREALRVLRKGGSSPSRICSSSSAITAARPNWSMLCAAGASIVWFLFRPATRLSFPARSSCRSWSGRSA